MMDTISKGATAIIVQKNKLPLKISVPYFIVEDSLKALQALAKAYRDSLKSKFIAISGSNGKTTTKDILAELLSETYKTQKTRGNLNNEYGVPLTLLELDEDCDIAVIEMGISKTKELSILSKIVNPDVAILTFIGLAHLETLGSLQKIAQAKAEIMDGLKEDGLLIYNGDNKCLQNELYNQSQNIEMISFGFNISNQTRIESYEQLPDGIRFVMNLYNQSAFYLPLLGRHQLTNAMAAILCAQRLNVPLQMIQNHLTYVQLSSLRNQVCKFKDFTIINDTYKSNPQSCSAALQTLFDYPTQGKTIAVLADMLDLGEQSIQLHLDISKQLNHSHCDYVFTLGALAINFLEYCDLDAEHQESYFDKMLLIKRLLPLCNNQNVILF